MQKTEVPKDNNIKLISMHDEMSSSYLSYAMSVIVSRALPDVRDGLKPVHRRIIYAMYKGGFDWSKQFRKSARVVGDVIGKYHPHGDQAVYDALVRLTQNFSMSIPLIDGQGNFSDSTSKIVGNPTKDSYKEGWVPHWQLIDFNNDGHMDIAGVTFDDIPYLHLAQKIV